MTPSCLILVLIKKKLAYVTSKGLNVLNLENMQTVTVYPDDPETTLLGKLDWVYQEELYGRGNYKGYWFSPDSSTIAFLRLDESGVNKFTITDHIPTRGKDEFLSYPKAGDPNPTVRLGVKGAVEQAIKQTVRVDYDIC